MSRAALGFCVFSCLAYLAYAANTPLSLKVAAAYDDGLFLSLGRSLASGDWLGPYDQRTLIKGPGYPLFLAATSWSGLPLQLTHALIHVASVGLFAWVARRLGAARWLVCALFLLLLWHPVLPLSRVLRAAIYPGLTLACLASAAAALFAARTSREHRGWSAVAALLLVAFWFTREEGVWILPGFALLALFAWAQQRRRLVELTVAMLGSLALAQLAFQVANARAYGSFSGLDIKQPHFEEAMSALQRVRDGGGQPYLPVSRETRAQLYRSSPAFATLEGYLDPPQGSPWQSGCALLPSTCGDIAGGWFLFALRDAVAAQGHHRSPAAASAFYAQLRDEVLAACEGALRCDRAWLSSTAPVLGGEALRRVPASLFSGALRSVLLGVALEEFEGVAVPGAGRTLFEKDWNEALAFLNRPAVWPAPTLAASHSVHGWFHREGDAWFEATADADSSRWVGVERRPSADLVGYLRDPGAVEQRFLLRTNCGDDCALLFRGDDGAELRVPTESITAQSRHALGAGVLYFESAFWHNEAPLRDDRRVRASLSLRRGLVALYRWLLPAVVVAGVSAFALMLARGWRRRALAGDGLTALAAAAWALVLSRLLLLATIDVSSFPALELRYLAPAMLLAAAASLLSLAALLRVR